MKTTRYYQSFSHHTAVIDEFMMRPYYGAPKKTPAYRVSAYDDEGTLFWASTYEHRGDAIDALDSELGGGYRVIV